MQLGSPFDNLLTKSSSNDALNLFKNVLFSIPNRVNNILSILVVAFEFTGAAHGLKKNIFCDPQY